MKLIKPKFKIMLQKPTVEAMYKQIEYAGRLCYASTDKITDGSYEKFITTLKKNGHNSPLEAGTVYLNFKEKNLSEDDYEGIYNFFDCNPYSEVIVNRDEFKAISNYRVLVENLHTDLLKYWDNNPILNRISVLFTTSRGVMDEYFRHRVFSVCAMSTRYCNLSKNKFGNEITFIDDGLVDPLKAAAYQRAEEYYLAETATEGRTAQYARNILPLGIASTYMMTGFIDAWEHFFELRDSNAAYPEAHDVAHKLKEAFIEKGLL